MPSVPSSSKSGASSPTAGCLAMRSTLLGAVQRVEQSAQCQRARYVADLHLEHPVVERRAAAGSPRTPPPPPPSRRTPAAPGCGPAAPGSAWPRPGTGPCRPRSAPARAGRRRTRRRTPGPWRTGRRWPCPPPPRAANPAMAVSVTFTLRLNGSVSPRAPSRVRWGRIEVCTAWNSCSGARAISSTLKVKPASAAPSAPPSVALTSSGPAFRNVCSASMITSTATAKPVPLASENSGSPPGSMAATSSRWRASAPASSSVIGGRGRPRARERQRHHRQRHDRRGGHAQRHHRLALGDAHRHGHGEQHPRAGLHQHQRAVQAEPAPAGQEAAREVADRVGQHRHDQHAVERGRAVEQVVLDRPLERQRGDHEHDAQDQLDRGRHAQVLVAGGAVGVALGDRARQQLLHRPVEHRHRDEDRRPQQRDAAVLGLGQVVRGQREVAVGDQPGGADPQRQQRGPALIAAFLGFGHGP